MFDRPQIVAQRLFERTLFFIRFHAGFASGVTRRSTKKRAALKTRGPHKLSGLFYLVVLAFVGSRRPCRVFGEVLLLVSPPFVFLFLVKSARTAAATLPKSIL